MTTEAPQWMTEDEAAAYCGGLRPQTLCHWRTTGKADQPPYTKIGRLVRYRRDALDEWLESRTVRPAAELN